MAAFPTSHQYDSMRYALAQQTAAQAQAHMHSSSYTRGMSGLMGSIISATTRSKRIDHERKNNIRTILQEETDEWLEDALK